MGQAWCKEKTSKAQDSKSPLDRVFVHCAHRIYPGLKEEGSVLGGATQRVTSSEIGYAGSPPREVLTRGRSIDSVDRPFHPSDWVDVNLEVPSTPRASSVLTNLTVDTSLYPATTPTSSCSNLKDVTPVPPPRRRKRNKGRPLPPKPDEIPENSSSNFKHADTNEEPLYSSVKPPKSNEDEQQDTENEVEGKDKPSSVPEDSRHEIKRTKEVYEHKVNGTGRIISSDVVSGRRTSTEEERKTCKTSETSQEQKRIHEDDEYDRFVRNQLVKDSSTPNRQERRINPKEVVNQQIKESSGDAEKIARTKNYSTVSLPNYDELDLSRHIVKRTKDENGDEQKTKSRRPVRSSTVSLPAESLLSPFSEKTSVRFEDYVSRRHIHENLSPYQVLEKLECPENGVVNGGFMKYDSRKSEEWNLHEDDDCELHLERRISFETTPVSEIDEEKRFHEDEDVVDFSPCAEIENHEKRLSTECKTSDDNTRLSPISLAKPEAFGKSTSTILDEKDSSPVDGNRSPLQYFDPPTLAGTCKASAACDSITTPVSREPFFLDEAKQRSALDTIGGSCRNSCNAVDADRSGQSRTIFARSLSNESEPYEETYESKELRGHRGVTSELIRTISEESLPREMLEEHTATDDFFDEKRAKDVSNKMKKDLVDQKAKTPPPSPEPRIRAEILDNDHSSLLKVLKEEAAEESNLSSMTPSLTELEAALSDMLEKEEQHEDSAKELIKMTDSEKGTSGCIEKLIEPEIVPVEKTSCSFNDDATIEATTSEMVTHGTTKDQFLGDDLKEKTDGKSLSLGQILEERKSPGKVRKVSFCTWEELNMAEIDLKNDQEFADRDTTVDFNKDDRERRNSTDMEGIPLITKDSRDDRLGFDVSPEKPSRLLRNLEDPEELFAENVPTPPRRRNKGSLGVGRREIEIAQNGSAIGDPYPNDRLI